MYKVLIVDDEPSIRELVAKYCALEGYSYGEAADGLEAIEKVRGGDYDIVIMDVMMPELDGFSAVREIRKFSKIPVIMLSARTETYDKIHGFEIGADDYLPKPFSPKELMLRIRNSGMGVRSCDLPHIFEKGFTGGTGDGRKNATGMGLYLAKGVAGEMNLKLEAASEWGKGFEIRVSFPGVD